MSRLPRPHSSPDPKAFAPSLIETQPAKKSTGAEFRPKPLQASASRNAIASSSASTANGNGNPKPAAVMPRPLTRTRPPAAARPTSRGVSAPPVSTVRKPSVGISIGVPSSRVPSSKRTASGSATAAAPDVITNLHKRLVTLESAHTQDKEQLVTLFESAVASSSAAAVTTTASAGSEALLAAQSQLASTSETL
ncbi:hypothetical protein K438DRAFT_1958913 [Mycena galopus ATCC 62051]|nr:hypothetical protein K438DRAFT_1958913 [Mycena galopus ATCC 62051]